MKKSNIASIIIFATLICVALDSCQKKDDVQKTETEVSVTSFYARSSGSGSPSKTSRQETGSVMWSPNDEITVFCGETSGKFVSQNEESADVATFIGSFDSPVSTSDVSSKGVVAFYPYSEDLSCSEGTVTFSLPASQPALAGTFDEELYPLIARSNSTELSFYNICGGAKFSVSQDGIKTVTFKGNASEPLAGKLSVTFDENGVPTVEVLEGETEIVVTAPDDGTFEVGKEYYIVTIPQSLAKGFTLIYNDGLSINNEFKTDKAITIRRSKFGVLKYLDEDLDMINLSDPIVFEDSAVEKKCVDKWDTDGDGSLSYAEAAAVKTIGTVFRYNTSITSFDEFQYFTGLTSIGFKAFQGCTSLTSVMIPEGVTSIENEAFDNCTSLTSVTIPSSVTSIGSSAFSGCTGECVVNCNFTSSYFLNGAKFTKVVIGEGVTIVNCSDLRNCSNLMSLTIPSSVTSLQGSFSYSFSGECEINCNFNDIFRYSKIKKVVIGEGVTSIKERAFNGCSGLTSVTIPSSVTSIEDRAFYDCRCLTSVTIPEGVTSIEKEVFYNCTSLTSVTIPSSVTSIGSNAFDGCSSLTSVTIPSSVTSIEEEVFCNCTSLTSVTIPEGVTSIEDRAFYNCTSLTSVTIPSSVTSIGSSAFSGCNNLKNVTFHSKCPPDLNSSAFNHSSSLCFFLPVESESAYLTAYPWKTFAESMVFGLKLPSAKGTYTYVGGTIEFDYIKDESLDVQPLVAVSDAWWISSLCDTGNSVRCELAENTSEYSRTGIVTVSYAGVNKTFNITQQGCLVTELSLNTDSMTLFAGDKVELIASVYPVDAKLQWSSSDPSIASVDQNGKVTGLNKGVADITVKSMNGNMSATCTVTVLLHVSGVSLDKTFAKVPKGENLALTVTVSPSDAYDKNVTWSSSNPSVATVSDQGVVSAHNVGKTTITVLTNDSGKKAECEVLVFIPIEDVILDKATVELIEGDSISLVPTLLPTDAFYDLIWSSSDTNVAKVSSTGKVAAVKAGTAEIVVKSEYSGESATCIVTVVKRTASGGMEGTEDEDWGI